MTSPLAPPTRRKFLSAFVAGAGALVAAVLGGIAARFLGGARGLRPAPVAIGPAGAFEGPGPVEAVLAWSRTDAWRSEERRQPIFVIRDGAGLAALSSTCSHLGCSVRWDGASRLFRCPCHGGTYRPDGSVAGGPPPAPLARLPIEIRAGQVYVRPPESA